MFGLFTFLGIVALASLILSPLIAISASNRAHRLDARVSRLQKRLETIESGLKEEDISDAVQGLPQTLDLDPASQDQPSPQKADIESSAPPAAPQPSASLSADVPPTEKSIEETVASRWLVWLGGVVIALGGIFLVKYSIDHDLLSPAVRIFIGILLGISLAVGGEWVRRRPVQKAIASVSPDYVPPALTGAGILIAFGSVYAGYALYDLLPPLVVFGLLTAIAAAALALSLLQGPFIAALGILGAFTVPLLVDTGAASAWGLFGYLVIVAGSAYAVVRYMGWWWLGWMTLLGSVIWQLFWFHRLWQPADLLALSLHMIALLAMGLAIRFGSLCGHNDERDHPNSSAAMSPPASFVFGTALGVSVLAFVLVRMDGYATESLIVFSLIATALVVFAFKLKCLETLFPLAAATSVILLATWHQPELVRLPEIILVEGREMATLPGPILPPEFSVFASMATLIAFAFGTAGYLGIRRSMRPDLWAAISAIVPLASLIVCYWRMEASAVNMAWGAVAIGLAVLGTIAAQRIVGERDRQGIEAALGIYALAVFAAISLAASMTLEETWLSIALAIQLPATAWIHNQLKIAYLRPFSALIAVIVGIRLLLLHHLPGSPLYEPLDGIWILYSYGIPAIAFGLAAKWFRETGDDKLVMLLESGTIAIAVATVSMEIRHFVGDGTLGYARYTLFEQSLHSLSWLASGCGLYYRYRRTGRAVALWGATVLIGLAAVQVVGLQVLVSNPLLTGDDVGSWPILNNLSLAYVVPAAFAIAIHLEAKRQEHWRPALWAGAFSFALLFIYVSLEVRHLFHGNDLTIGPMTNAEGYTYSLVWLIYAGSLLAAGMVWRIPILRHTSLGLVFLVVAKLFLWDMSWLTGLYRVASFLGLGFSLVAIGFFYQRFVLRPGQTDVDPAAETTPD
ncbi:MAG: DUF2339 domain-containing protein [Rhodospirillales bacterium]|nr:DUF2339 domain-containing protein [Rhodospirillales bacterium]